jgi:hypothetical protein
VRVQIHECRQEPASGAFDDASARDAEQAGGGSLADTGQPAALDHDVATLVEWLSGVEGANVRENEKIGMAGHGGAQ